MRAALLGAAVVIAGATACGAGDGGGAAGSPGPVGAATPRQLEVGPARDFGDACRLLSASEVRAGINAGAVTPSSRRDPQLGSFCTYTAAGGTGVPLLTVQVEVLHSAAEARAAVDAGGGPAVSGLGDAARQSRPGGLGVAVYIARGATYALLSSAHRDVTEAALQRLAGTLVGRLG